MYPSDRSIRKDPHKETYFEVLFQGSID